MRSDSIAVQTPVEWRTLAVAFNRIEATCRMSPVAGEAEAASGRAAELEAEVGRLTELAAKLEEDLLAADGGAGGYERRENGIDGIIADGAVFSTILTLSMWMSLSLSFDVELAVHDQPGNNAMSQEQSQC
jgi:hypothetical protein